MTPSSSTVWPTAPKTTSRPPPSTRIACRLLEHITGIEPVPTHRTRGPLPPQRLEAIEKLVKHHKNGGHRLRSVKLSPELAGAIAIQLADYAETIHRLNA